MEELGHVQTNREERISTAPLHVAYNCRRWILDEELKELRRRFPNIETTEWTRDEITQLKDNWNHIVEHYPEHSDAKYAFATGHDVESHLTPKQVDKKRDRYDQFEIMLRMAYGLPNRLICDIYLKCRSMFYEKSFFFSSRGRVPSELEKTIKNNLSLNESCHVIAHKYNVSPNVIRTIMKHPERLERFKWTESAEEDLRQAIRSIYDFGDYSDLPARNIDWKRVQARMTGLGYVMTQERCYNKWVRLYPNSKRRASR